MKGKKSGGKRKAVNAPKTFGISPNGTMTGYKGSGGCAGKVSQPSTKPHKGKTNP